MTPGGGSVVAATVADVDDWRGRLGVLGQWLDAVERDRAAAFADPDVRDRFVIAHGLLRLFAGRRLGCSPGTVIVGRDGRGRPSLSSPASVLRCSLSHAGRRVAVALAEGAEVGIDVEPVDPARVDLATLRRYLDPATADGLARLPGVERTRAAARAWTALEAEAKGRGVSPDTLRGRERTGFLVELDAGAGHVASLWTALPVSIPG